jgi:thiamine biosynthesis lipoprotein
VIATLQTMGTVASIDIQGASVHTADLDAVRAVFEGVEARFSLYRENSELSRIARGDLLLTRASDEVRSVYEEALLWRSATSGAFTPHRPDGVLDLDGIVKAIAIRDAGATLLERKFTRWCLNVGGDVLTSGSPIGAPAWTIGIVDPADRAALLCSIDLVNGMAAIATSGTAERGEHVWRTEVESDLDYVQVSVLSEDIVTSDVLATAILAGGPPMLDTATERWDVDVFTVARSGALSMTPRMRSWLSGAH